MIMLSPTMNTSVPSIGKQITKIEALKAMSSQYSEFAELVENEREGIDIADVAGFNYKISNLHKLKLAKYIRNLIDKTLSDNDKKLAKIAELIQPLVCSFLRIFEVINRRAKEFTKKAVDSKRFLEVTLKDLYMKIRSIFGRMRLNSPDHIFNSNTKAYKIIENIFETLQKQYILPKQILCKTRLDGLNDYHKELEVKEFEGFFSQNRNLEDALSNYNYLK